MRVLLLTLLVVSLAACGGADEPASTSPSVPEAGSEGATVTLPPGWHTMPRDDGVVADPRAVVAVSSGPMANRETDCQVSDYGPEDDAVALIVLEWQPNDDSELPPRPAQFGAEELPVTEGNIECFEGSGGTVQFVDGGREFGAYVLLGPDAPGELADEARAVLETLRVEPAQP